MRQGVTSQRLEGEAETSLARGLLSMSRGNVGVTSPFVLPSPRMGSSSVMPIWALITQLTSSHFWTDCKTSSLQLTRCTRQSPQDFAVFWDNVSFHRSALVQNWFQHHPQFTIIYLPPGSTVSSPNRRVFLGMAVEGVRSPAPGSGTLHSGHGG